MTYTLNLYTNPQDGATGFTWVGRMTSICHGWTPTKRLQGGWWEGNFRLILGDPGDGGVTEDQLLRWYYNRLGYLFQEKEGGLTTWMGQIVEMNLCYHGDTGRRSLNDVYNYVWANYTDTAGAAAVTAAVSNTESIKRYGQKENILTLSMTQLDATAATQQAQNFLDDHAWSREKNPGASLYDDDTYLDVTVRGYVDTLAWHYITAAVADGTDTDLSDWVLDVFTEGDQLLKLGSITANTTQIRRTLLTDTTCWEALLDAVGIGDASNNFYRIFVTTDRRFHYSPISMEPMYYKWRGKLYNSAQLNQEVSPRNVAFGVIRRMDYPQTHLDDNSPFQDSRDFIPDEISVSWDNQITLTPADLDEASLAEAQRRNEYLLTVTEEAAAGVKAPKLSKKKKNKRMMERNVRHKQRSNRQRGSGNMAP